MNKPTVTALAVNEKSPDQRDLYIDGAFYATLPMELVFGQDLYVGAPFGEEEEAGLLLAAQLIPAKEKAYQYLSYGDLSRKRLYEKLTRFGIEPHVAEATCDQMEQKGFIDDERLAARLAERYAREKKWGPRRIVQELYQKGFSLDLAKETTQGLDADYEQSVAYHLSAKYGGQDFSDRKQVQKVIQGLMRLGFDYETIRSGLACMTEDLDE